MIPRYLLSFDTEELPTLECDALVVGSGVAGLSTALLLSRFCRVLVMTKSGLHESTTRHAQGGIAAVMDEHDSIESHFKDTITAGAGLSDPEATEVLVREGPSCVLELLQNYDAEFDMTDGRLDLAMEGGHSRARVVHAKGDATGSEVESALGRALLRDERVEVREYSFVADLLLEEGRFAGALVVDTRRKLLMAVRARAVVLASGGMGRIYLVTTNPEICTGDGIAAAFRAGARISDVEFMQFHPTALHIPEEPKFLISEALRGDGARLVDVEGNRVMEGIHPLEDLAPRDIVVARMFDVMKEQQKNHLYLDVSPIGSERLKKRFPTICEHCLAAGIDLSRNRIPVSPAAHYMSGGVVTDLDGQTDIQGVFACGEVACTGIHGANRLASNSLLEGLVFAHRIANCLSGSLSSDGRPPAARASYSRKWLAPSVTEDLLKGNLREIMTDSVGIMRCERGLKEALEFVRGNQRILETEYLDVPGMELKNMFTVAELIATAAFMREESRGCHRRRDYPETDDWNWKRHIDIRLAGGQIGTSTRLARAWQPAEIAARHTLG